MASSLSINYNFYGQLKLHLYLGMEWTQNDIAAKHEANKQKSCTYTESDYTWSSSFQCYQKNLQGKEQRDE